MQAQAFTLPEPAKTELGARVKQALGVLAGADPATLAVQINALESDVGRAASAARAGGAAATAGGGVTYRKLQFAWRDAQGKARKQLDQFVAAVLADKDIQADPRFGEAKAAASEIGDMMPEFGTGIETALADIDDAETPAARASAVAAARKVLGDYRKMLDDADDLRALQELSDDEYGGISFFGELQQSLESLEAQLAKAR